MKPEEEWIDELVRRQDNIDPIRRIPNSALFHGTLINGTRRLNKAQRLGAVILGLFGLAFGCFELAGVIAALRSWSVDVSTLFMVVYSPFSLWMGWRITMNALINDPGKLSGRKTQ